MSNQSIIEHKANYYYVEFREDYLQIALHCAYKKPVKEGQKSKASSHCKALILSILENWTNTKRGQGDSLSIYMSYPQWEKAMYEMFSRSVIIDSLEELAGEGLIGREECMMYGRKTFRYTLNYKLLNERMKTLPDRDPHCTYPKTNGDDPSSPDGDPSKSKRDPSKNTLVASTNGRDPSKNTSDSRLKVNASDVKRDDDPSKSKRNIESYIKPSQHHNTEPTEGEREEEPPTSSNLETSFIHSDIDLNSSQEMENPTLIQHRLYPFIFLDDEVNPTTIFVQFGDPDDEHGFNHIAHTAHDVQSELEGRLGYKLIRKTQYEQESIEGGVTNPPASVKGVSLSTATGGGNSSAEENGPAEAPIVSELTTVGPPDNDASMLKPVPQSVTENATEEVTRKILLGWMTRAGVALGLAASCEKAVGVLLPLVKSEKDVIDLVAIERKRHPSGVIYVSNLANPIVIKEFEESRQARATEVPEPTPTPQYGMDRQTCSGLIDDNILALYPELEPLIHVDEQDAPLYFIGISLGNNQWIDIACPDDWYYLPKETVEQAVQYSLWLLQKEARQRKIENNIVKQEVIV